jgi:hypothetical protein
MRSLDKKKLGLKRNFSFPFCENEKIMRNWANFHEIVEKSPTFIAKIIAKKNKKHRFSQMSAIF